MLSEFLTITRDDNQVLPYNGILLRRLAPKAEEFISLSIEKTLTVSVDISTVYSFNEPGIYTIQYIAPIIYQQKDVSIEEKTDCASYIRIKRRAIQQTVGDMIRDVYTQSAIPCTPTTYRGVCAPLFARLTSLKLRQQTNQIHKAVFSYLDPAIRSINKDRSHYRKWFGSHNVKYVQRVRTAFTMIKSAMKKDTFLYVYNGKFCKYRRVLAYTWRRHRVIVLCPIQYRFPSILHPYSQLATLLHEMTHAVASTSDLTYSIRKCFYLAKHYPERAIENAATYGFFFTTILPMEYGVDSIGEYGNRMYITTGPVYVRYTNMKLDCNYPKLIFNNWGTIPAVFNDGFDTILFLSNGGVFITKQSKTLYYTSVRDKEPKIGTIDSHWGTLPSSFMSGFDSAVQLQDGKTYFTKGSQYVRYSNFPKSLSLDSGHPKLIRGNWGNINVRSFTNNLDAIASFSNQVCLYKGEKYITFESSKYYVPNSSITGTIKSLQHNLGKLKLC